MSRPGFRASTGRRSLAAFVAASLALAVAASATVLLAACTSGATPDCSDAAEMCDPYEAGSDSGTLEASPHGG